MEPRKKSKVQQVHRIPWNARTLASTYLSCASLLEMMEFMVLWCRQKWLALLYQVNKLTTITSLEKYSFFFTVLLSALMHMLDAFISTWWNYIEYDLLIYRTTNMPISWTSWLCGWRWPFDLPCWVYWRVRYIHYQVPRLSLMSFAKFFLSHSSLRGSCIHEWFRLHGNGCKEKLTADGQFIVFLGHAITHKSNICCFLPSLQN